MQPDKARKAAEHILEDRRSADYYQNSTVLSDYLAGTLGFAAEEARRVAQAIQEDRRGANFYQDVEILTDFLRR